MSSTDDERWVEANSILGRYTTPSAAARQRRRRRTVWLIVVGTALASGVVGGITGGLAASGGHPIDTNEAAPWQYVVGFALSGIGLIGGIASLVSLIRAGQWGVAWRSPTSVLTRRQRKELLREVRGQEPLDPSHLGLAKDLARRLVIQRRQVLVMASFLLLWAGQLIVFHDPLHLTMFGLFVLLGAAAIPLFLRDANRAQRFLHQHDARDSDG